MVKNYIEGLKKRRVLRMLDHGVLWGEDPSGGEEGRSSSSTEDTTISDDSDEDHVGDDLFDNGGKKNRKKKKVKKPSGGGSWILRQSVPKFLDFFKGNNNNNGNNNGGGDSRNGGENGNIDSHIGIKLTTSLEDLLYTLVVKNVMKGVVNVVGNIHGVGIGGLADIKIRALDPSSGGFRSNGGDVEEQLNYPQLGIITEQLLSQMQLAAPLLKLLPIKLQRSLLQNLIIILTFTIRDALRGVQLNLLGSTFKLDLTPIHFKYVAR